jgi:hypothetical protein
MVRLDSRHPDQDARLPPEVLAADREQRRQIAILAFLERFGLLRLLGVGQQLLQDLPPGARERYSAAYYTNQFWNSVQAQDAVIAATEAQVRATGGLGDRPLKEA